jgi:hypothetical protein
LGYDLGYDADRRCIREAALGGPYDAASPINQNQDELLIIEAGIARLG